MKFKSSLKYYLSGLPKSLIIFYGIIYAILFCTGIWAWTSRNVHIRWDTGGFESASVIFLLIVGLNSFKPNFRMLLANGVSRVTMFKSFAVSVLPLAGVMAFVDSLNGVVFSSFSSYSSMYSQVYQARYAGLPAGFGTTLQIAGEGFLWLFFTYAATAMIGFLITTLYYRMNKPLKLGVSIGVPVFLFVVLPYVDTHMFGGAIFRGIGNAIRLFWGFSGASPIPYIAMLACAVSFAVFGLFSYLAMRKAYIKD